MATNKNITMKQFNGTDYDTLYPKTIASQIPDVYSKTEILTTETLEKYGFTSDNVPDDVFQQIKTLIDNMQNSVDNRAKIQTGSYVGTGTYGKDNPTILTFPFKPKLLAIQNDEETNLSFNTLGATTDVIVRGVTRFPDRTQAPGTGYIEWGENTISIYSGMSASYQKNESGVTYYYVAIC